MDMSSLLTKIKKKNSGRRTAKDKNEDGSALHQEDVN
jgi:hypothetical protein